MQSLSNRCDSSWSCVLVSCSRPIPLVSWLNAADPCTRHYLGIVSGSKQAHALVVPLCMISNPQVKLIVLSHRLRWMGSAAEVQQLKNRPIFKNTDVGTVPKPPRGKRLRKLPAPAHSQKIANTGIWEPLATIGPVLSPRVGPFSVSSKAMFMSHSWCHWHMHTYLSHFLSICLFTPHISLFFSLSLSSPLVFLSLSLCLFLPLSLYIYTYKYILRRWCLDPSWVVSMMVSGPLRPSSKRISFKNGGHEVSSLQSSGQ